jgi:hypothetical protein
MKDTQVIVSSEAVWYSRHDGYTLDSRDSLWKHQHRTTFRKPSKIFRIPELLTSIDGVVCMDFQSPEKRR